MKKNLSFSALLLMLLFGVAQAWAEEVTYSPVLEVNFRTNSGNTGWQTVKNAADEGNTNFEQNYSAGFFSLQKYTVANLQNVTKLVLTITVGGSSGVDAHDLWSFANTTWTAETGVDDIVPLVESTVGIAPRATEGTVNTPLVKGGQGVKVAGSNPAKAAFAITGTALETLKANASADGTFTLLITNNAYTSNSKRTYQSSNTANEEDNRPTLTAVVETPAVTLNGVGYETLAEAIAAVAEGGEGTLIVNKDITLTSRVNVGSRNITIKGATGNEKILRGTGYTNGLCFLTVKPGEGLTSELTLQDIIFDGQNLEAVTPVFEASNFGTTTLKNFTFVNCKNTDTGTDDAIISNKSNGKLVLDGVTFTDCSATKGMVFVGTGDVTLMGNNLISDITIEKNLTITATEATHTTPINLVIADTRTAGTLVKGGKLSQYTISGGPEGYELAQNGQNVDLVAISTSPNVVKEETGTNYATLQDAVNSVVEGTTATLIINVPQEISSRLDVKNKNIILKAGTDGTIKRSASYTDGLCFLTLAPDAGNTSQLTLQGITFDGQNLVATAPVFEASNYGTTTLKDVTFINCKNVHETNLDAAIISNKSGGKLVLDGVTFTNCSATKGMVFVGTDNVSLAGNNTIASMSVEGNHMLKADNATATSPIALVTDNARTWGMMVQGGDAAQFANSSFRLSQQMDGVYSMPLSVAASFAHPALLHTADDIARVKANLTEEPWKSAYSRLEAQSGGAAAGAVEVLKRMDKNNWESTYSDYSNFSHAATDARLAYELALRYQLKGSTAAATAAVKILNDWAKTCKGMLRLPGYNNNIPDPNEYLICIQAYQFANAAELLRGYSGWQAEDFAQFQNWIRQTFADVAILFLENHGKGSNPEHYWLNWDLAALNAMLSVGILCDDQALVDYALTYTTAGEGNGNIAKAVVATHRDPDSRETLAQCQESGRDQGHSTLNVTLLGVLCQTAQNIGTDLFTPYKALEMAEYIGKYNLMTPDDAFVYGGVPFAEYTNGEDTHTVVSDYARGTVRPSWELFHAYAQKKGLADKYTEAWVKYQRLKNAWGEGEGTSTDELGFGTLMFGSDMTTDSYTLTVTDAGAATMVLPFDAELPTGVKAYTLTYTAGDDAAVATPVSSIKANQPVLVNAEAGDYTFTSTAGKVDVPYMPQTCDALTGVYATTTVPAGGYLLTNHDGKVAFRKADGTSNMAEANRAYLFVDGASAPLLRITLDGETDAIELVSAPTSTRKYFDLSGRQLVNDKLPKGLYIVNGKKCIIK